MSSFNVIFYIILILEGIALLYAFVRKKGVSGRSFIYPTWLIVFLCLISLAFNFANYAVMRGESSMGLGDIIAAIFSFAFVAASIGMSSYVVVFDNDELDVSSIFGKKNIRIAKIASVTLQMRTRGSWWIDIVSDGEKKTKISGVVDGFRALCSRLDTELNKAGSEIVAMDALGKTRPFSELH